MPQPMMGKPAGTGTKPERYALRVPFSLGARVQADELSRIPMWGVIPVQVGGRPATIERLEMYFILRVGGFASEK